jgi:hypothetical protein
MSLIFPSSTSRSPIPHLIGQLQVGGGHRKRLDGVEASSAGWSRGRQCLEGVDTSSSTSGTSPVLVGRGGGHAGHGQQQLQAATTISYLQGGGLLPPNAAELRPPDAADTERHRRPVLVVLAGPGPRVEEQSWCHRRPPFLWLASACPGLSCCGSASHRSKRGHTASRRGSTVGCSAVNRRRSRGAKRRCTDRPHRRG